MRGLSRVRNYKCRRQANSLSVPSFNYLGEQKLFLQGDANKLYQVRFLYVDLRDFNHDGDSIGKRLLVLASIHIFLSACLL